MSRLTRGWLPVLGLLAVLAFLVPAQVGAVVPPDREVTGVLQTWGAGASYVVVDGQRYGVSRAVQVIGDDGARLQPVQVPAGTSVTLYITRDEVYQVSVHNKGGARR